MSIHLSDMGLEFEEELQKDILETFGLGDEDDQIVSAANQMSHNKVRS